MMLRMRTTVTLDPDVADRLRVLARERGLPFKRVLNDAIRDGFHARVGVEPYRLPTRPMGLRSGVDLTKALALASALEDEELLRKRALRR